MPESQRATELKEEEVRLDLSDRDREIDHRFGEIVGQRIRELEDEGWEIVGPATPEALFEAGRVVWHSGVDWESAFLGLHFRVYDLVRIPVRRKRDPLRQPIEADSEDLERELRPPVSALLEKVVEPREARGTPRLDAESAEPGVLAPVDQPALPSGVDDVAEAPANLGRGWILGAVLVAAMELIAYWRVATSRNEIASPTVATPVQPARDPDPALRATPGQSTELFVNVVLMNVREQAETGAIVGKLPIATRCERLGSAQGDWLHIRCAAVEGWAKSAYLSPTIPTVDDLSPKMRLAPDPKEALQLSLRILALDPGNLEAEAYADAKFFECEWADLAAERQAGRSRGEIFEHECGDEDPTTNCLMDALAARVRPEWLRIEFRDQDVIVVSKENDELYTRSGAVTRTGTAARLRLDLTKHYRAPVMLSVLSGTAEGSSASTQHPFGSVGDVQEGCGCYFAPKPDSRENLFVREYGGAGAWVHTGGRDVKLTCSALFETKALGWVEKCASDDGAVELRVRYVSGGRAGYEWTPLRALISGRIGGATSRLIAFGGCGC